MADLLLTAVLAAVAGACEYVRLKKSNRQSEMVPYVLFSLAGLALFSVYTMWQDMPSMLDLMKAALGQKGW